MIWNLKQTSLIVASASAVFAAWTTCDAGLFDSLFHRTGKCELPRRAPARDCSFGHFPTNWRPWDTCCDQPQNAPSSPTYYSEGSVAPYDTLPKSEAIYEGQPLTVPAESFPPTSRDWPAGTIIAPPVGQPLNPGLESPIPVPSTGPIRNSFPETQQPATGPQNIAPLPPGSVPTGTAIPGPLYPANPQPSPLPPADPSLKSIEIPDPAQPQQLDSRFVPPVPGTARYMPARRMEIPLQPTSHTQPSFNRRPQYQPQDGSEWRVMRHYYDGRPSTGVSSLSRGRRHTVLPSHRRADTLDRLRY
jgi:hypothetical protein